MNITSYFSEEDLDPVVYRGRLILKERTGIIDADESIYRFLGDNSGLPLTSLVHPDERDAVADALKNLADTPQRLIFRLMSANGNYRYVYGVFTIMDRIEEGVPCINVDITDIMRIHSKFDRNHANLIKYRKQMTLSDQFFLDYNYKNDEVIIYEYINGRSKTYVQSSLKKLCDDYKEKVSDDPKKKIEADSFLEMLEARLDYGEIRLDGALLGLDCERVNLKGGILYQDDRSVQFTAVLSIVNPQEGERKYYMGSQAFDSFTSLYNKRAITELTIDLLAQAEGQTIYQIIIDVDDFKDINDTYGHLAGDDVIACVARVLKSTVGNRGYVGRFGGDEFVIVTHKISSDEELMNMLKTIRKHILWNCGEICKGADITTSIGVAKYPVDAGNYDDLFQIADKCLYIAKAKGKNRFIIYDPKLHENFDMASGKKTQAKKHMPLNYVEGCRIITQIMTNGQDDSLEFLKADMEMIRDRFGIDRVSIYAGEDYERKFFVTLGPEPLESLKILNGGEADSHFDANGVLIRNKILLIKEFNENLYQELSEQKVTGYIAIKHEINNVKLLVVYDIVGRLRKWAETEKGLLYLASRVLAKRYISCVEAEEQ